MKPLGTPITAPGPKPLPQAPDQTTPGFGWKLSAEAQRDIDAIEHNSRTALHRLRNIMLD